AAGCHSSRPYDSAPPGSAPRGADPGGALVERVREPCRHVHEVQAVRGARLGSVGPAEPARPSGQKTPRASPSGPRTKYRTKSTAAIHMSGCTWRTLPTAMRMTTKVMKPAPMPAV